MKIVFLALFLCFAAGAYDISPDVCSRAAAQAVRLTNDKLEIRFSLTLGRLVWFGEKGGKNLLWLNDDKIISDYHKRHPRGYLNFGGDKIWSTPQCLWETVFGKKWPPAIPLEGMPWTIVQQSANTLAVKSQLIPHLGIELQRTFTLLEKTPVLVVKNTIRRISANPYPVQLWSISQLKMPTFCIAEIPEKKTPYSRIFYNRPEYGKITAQGRVLRQELCFEEFGSKSGTLGRFAGAVYPDGKVLLQIHKVRPEGCYPERASIQLHTNSYYVELETLDELCHLLPGESRSNQVIWSIFSTKGNGSAESDLYKIIFSKAEDLYKSCF